MNTKPQTAATAENDDALLASMLGELGGEDIVEEAHTEDAEGAVEAAAEAAVADEPEAVAAEKPKKEKKAKKVAEPKAPRITSITHKPGDRLVALLGDKTWLQFNKTEDDATNAKRAEQFIADMNSRDAIADKVKDKAIMLFTWIASGKDQSGLNEVMLRAFQVLNADGELTSGKNGNLQTNLLAKPYSPGTAASQANQMFMLFPLLGITKREKGKMVADTDSALLEVVNAKLGL